MSWLHKTLSTYGRIIAKPEKPGKAEEVNDEAIPIQDQIENLRAKIQLKERYNKALTDDLNESHQGTTSFLRDLTRETRELRHNLFDAINSERAAVQNALRTHREFQLALTNRTPAVSVPWLDDKLCDIANILNSQLDRLKDKRHKLEESEEMVMVIEKWPRPGSLPWEVEAMESIHRLECLIEAQKVRRETAQILNATYYRVKIILRGERGKYASVLKNMETGLQTLKNELTNLQMMLDDAVHFRDEAYKNLILTEKESSENRRRRRKQMAKMKKAVEKILEENSSIPMQQQNKVPEVGRLSVAYPLMTTMSGSDVTETLRIKRQEVEEFQERARRLVETMRVKDLTHIPIRLKTVATVGNRLREEREAKEKLKNLYVRQKGQLMLILYYHRYTGVEQAEMFEHYKKEYNKAIDEVHRRKEDLSRRLDIYGDINAQLRLGLMALNERFSDGKRKPYHRDHDDMKAQMRAILGKTKRLVRVIEDLNYQFEGKDPASRDYGNYVKNPQIAPRLIRVGTPAVSEESEGDDDLTDAKVPGRVEIKQKSLRLVSQALLKKGIH